MQESQQEKKMCPAGLVCPFDIYTAFYSSIYSNLFIFLKSTFETLAEVFNKTEFTDRVPLGSNALEMHL